MPDQSTIGDALLLIGHGSREGEAIAEYHQFAEKLAADLHLPVYPCFLEFADPPIVAGIRACIEAGAHRVVALPLFLGPAGHQKNDVPTILNWAKTQWPQVEFKYGVPLGAQPQIVSVLAQRTEAAISTSPATIPAAETALVLVGRGSRDPDSNSELYKIARMLWEGRDYGWVEVAFYSLTAPDITTTIERCIRLGARRVVVLPYLLFTGAICQRTGAQAQAVQIRHPDVEILMAAHLSTHPEIIEAVKYRYREVIAGTAMMTCDLCKYRHRFVGFEEDYGLPQGSDHHHGLRGMPHTHGPRGHSHEQTLETLLPPHRQMVDYIQDPAAITADSFTIIRAELRVNGYQFEPSFAAVIERLIHSTADFDFAAITQTSPDAIEAGVQALRAGCSVITDVHMVQVGISTPRLAALGGAVHCLVTEDITRQRAQAAQITRSAMGIRLAAERGLLEGNIVAIGNAPTALVEVIRCIEVGLHPALVIGVPVGFVSTAESKAALMQVTTVPWLVTAGRKGGSTVAVAVVNALLRLAGGSSPTEVD